MTSSTPFPSLVALSYPKSVLLGKLVASPDSWVHMYLILMAAYTLSATHPCLPVPEALLQTATACAATWTAHELDQASILRPCAHVLQQQKEAPMRPLSSAQPVSTSRKPTMHTYIITERVHMVVMQPQQPATSGPKWNEDAALTQHSPNAQP